MFRKTILVRAQPPTSLLSSPFLLIQISITDLPSPSSPSLSIELETLCCKLSRKWRLACFHQSHDIFVIYQGPQSDSAARVVTELTETLPISNVSAVEELKEPSLIAKAIECGLRSVMLDNNWRCVAENTFIDSTLACGEERTFMHALNVRIQSEKDDHVIFLVSPDVVRFNRHKVLDLVMSKTLQRFDDGEEITLEEDKFLTNCTVLPYLHEGHVMGLSKLRPVGENFEKLDELWLLKYGLSLPSNHFVNVRFIWGGHVNKKWFPSSFVLQGSGFIQAPQTIRASKAVHALKSFIELVGAWNFFDQGLLKVKDISSLGVGTLLPVWNTATTNFIDSKARNNSICGTYESITEKNLISEGLLSILDFRTPKPCCGSVFGNMAFTHVGSQSDAKFSCKISLDIKSKNIGNADIISSSGEFRPVLMELATITENTSTPGFTESGCVNGSIATKENDISPVVHMQREGTSIQVSGGNIQLNYSASRKKEKTEAFLELKSLADPRKESGCVNDIMVNKENHIAPVVHLQREGTSFQIGGGNIQLSSKASGKKEKTKAYLSPKSLTDPRKGCTDSGRVNDNIVTKENHIAPVVHQQREGTSIQIGGGNIQLSSKVPRNKEKTEAFIDFNSLPDPKKVPSVETLGKRSLDNEMKSDDTLGDCTKMRHKQDKSEITTKVADYFGRGKLQSLTVADLKCFLSAKKAKVGGKKDELIQRITALFA